MDVVVVGGGLVGLATAYQILRARPRANVTVLEKEPDVCRHQSGHNSGVLHAGLYYTPGSAKARLAVRGIRMMVEFCREHDIPHDVCGKLVVATEPEELPRLEKLFERGTANGLSGLRRLTPEEAKEIEPNVRAIAAVHVPEEGIVDYPRVGQTLVKLIEERGGTVRTRAEVHALRPNGSSPNAEWTIESSAGAMRARVLLNCAGLYADRIARMAGEQTDMRVIPFRGEYYLLKPERSHLVRNLIYPVPDPTFPFLGVHFTRLIHGGVEGGPNAVLALSREGYKKSDVAPGDVMDSLTFPGLWRFLAKYPKTSWFEVRRSFSPRMFTQALQRLVPAVQAADLVPGGAGVRAQAMLPNGNLVEDFLLVKRPNAVHVLNAPSPAATASLAIGEEMAQMVGERLDAHPQIRV
jgi:L-2-hydroxyglutarate oxidase LhgO